MADLTQQVSQRFQVPTVEGERLLVRVEASDMKGVTADQLRAHNMAGLYCANVALPAINTRDLAQVEAVIDALKNALRSALEVNAARGMTSADWA